MAGDQLTLSSLLTELLPALEHIHGLGLVHRDLKPENIFLRSHEPFDLVLGDFGLVRLVEGSMHLTHGDGTPAYLPPEADSEEAEVTSAWDWWSVGMICAELSGGRHPFALAGGQLASAAQIRRHLLAQKPIDLSAVSGERELLLCRGLLLADRGRRWGADEVRAWLAGESPPLPAAAAAAAAAAPAGARTVLFAENDYADAASLAAAFQERWDAALTQLFQERNAVLVDELKDLLNQEHNSDALAALTEQVLPAEVSVRFARLLVKMDPQLRPKVGTITVTQHGLEEAAGAVVQHPGERSSLASALRTVRDCAVLRSWRGLEGMARGPEIERAWLELLGAYEHATRTSVPAAATPDPDLAAAWLLLVALDPERRMAELHERIERAAATPTAEAPWWAALAARKGEPAALLAALLTQGTAEVLGREAREARRAAEEERRRAEEEARRAEEERLRAEEEAARPGELLKASLERATTVKEIKAAVRESQESIRAANEGAFALLDHEQVCKLINWIQKDYTLIVRISESYGLRDAVKRVLGIDEKALKGVRKVPLKNGDVIIDCLVTTSTGSTVTIRMANGQEMTYERSELLFGNSYFYAKGFENGRYSC